MEAAAATQGGWECTLAALTLRSSSSSSPLSAASVLTMKPAWGWSCGSGVAPEDAIGGAVIWHAGCTYETGVIAVVVAG